MEDSSDEESFQWLSELDQDFQVSNWDSSTVILQYSELDIIKIL